MMSLLSLIYCISIPVYQTLNEISNETKFSTIFRLSQDIHLFRAFLSAFKFYQFCRYNASAQHKHDVSGELMQWKQNGPRYKVRFKCRSSHAPKLIRVLRSGLHYTADRFLCGHENLPGNIYSAGKLGIFASLFVYNLVPRVLSPLPATPPRCEKRYYEIKYSFSKTFVIKHVLYPKILCKFSSELLYIYVSCSNLN